MSDSKLFSNWLFGIIFWEVSGIDFNEHWMLEIEYGTFQQAEYQKVKLNKKSTLTISASVNDDWSLIRELGGQHAIAANRIPSVFKSKGPGVNATAAYPSSSVVIGSTCRHLAHCAPQNSVLVTGSNALLHPIVYKEICGLRLLSISGRHFVFDTFVHRYVCCRKYATATVQRVVLSLQRFAEVLDGFVNQNGQNVAQFALYNLS